MAQSLLLNRRSSMFPHVKMTNWTKFPSLQSELVAFADTPLTKKNVSKVLKSIH